MARPDDEREPDGHWLRYARENPVATAALAVCVIAGAVLGYALIGDSLSPPRRILGGALAGAGSWLLVMVGRVIG